MSQFGVPGLYKRGEVFWFQPGMKYGIRPAAFSLDTSDLATAQRLAHEARAQPPTLARPGRFLREAEAYLKARAKLGEIRDTEVNNRMIFYRRFNRECDEVDLERLTTIKLQYWYDQRAKQICPNTVNQYLQHLSGLFDWLIAQKRLRTNPAKEIKRVRRVKATRKVWLPLDQANALIEAARPDPELCFILFAGFHAGMRKIEIVEAIPAWLDLNPRAITISPHGYFRPKDSEERTVPLTKAFREFLNDYPNRRARYLLQPDRKKGKHRYRYDFKRKLENFLGEHGLRSGPNAINTHDLRRSFASNLVSKGISIYKVAKWLGDDIETTQKRYAHLAPHDDDISALM